MMLVQPTAEVALPSSIAREPYMPVEALPFRPGSVAWRVFGETHVTFAAARALLLQTAHPSVAAGVEHHSNYKAEPWERLLRTLDTVTKIGFAEPELSQKTAERMRRRHVPVKGTRHDGQDYDGEDPVVGLWVWATLVDSAALAWERTHGRLSDQDRQRFLDETTLFAEASGIPRELCPETWEEFRAYVEGVIEQELEATPSSHDVGRATTAGVPTPVIGSLIGAVNEFFAAALLPESVRQIYGLSTSPARQRTANALMRVFGATQRVTPDPMRHAMVHAVLRWDLMSRTERRMRKRAAASRRDQRAA